MSSVIDEFINNIDVDEELKKQKIETVTEDTSKDLNNQDPQLSKLDVAADVAASAATGAAQGLTYVIDLPFFIVQGIESGSEYLAEKAITAMGFNTDEYQEMKSDIDIALENSNKFKPGEYIRENFLTYDSKTKLGDYAMSVAEFAAPGGLLGKTQKARNLFMATGAASGAVAQGAEDLGASENVAPLIGAGTNLALDILALKKGNLAVLSKEFLPSKSVLEKAKQLEKEAKKIDKDFTLSGAEATGSSSVKAAESQVTATIAGNKVMDKYWSDRPDKLKNFIEKWGKQNGIIIGSRQFISDKDYYKQLKKAAVALQTQRSTQWLRSGGDNLKDFFYDSQKVDNLVIEFKNLAKGLEPSDAKTILKFAKNLQKTKGNGQAMHNVYREIRDTYFNIVGKSQTASQIDAVKNYRVMKDSLNKLMSTNKDYVSAQKAYIKYNDEYAKPLTKGSITELFKSLEKAKSAEDVATVAKMWKFLDTKAAPKDIAQMAKSINKSGVPGLWQKVVTGYVNQAFLKSQSKHLDNGLSQGVIFHDAIMKDPKQKANLAEMLFQLSKTTDPNVKLKDVKNAVNVFADILKATGKGGKAGSTTAANLLYRDQASKNKLQDVFGGVPIRDGILRWYNDRTFSKNSKIIAEALTSDRGIQAFIDLTQDWKDYNKAFALLRAVTVGAGASE